MFLAHSTTTSTYHILTFTGTASRWWAYRALVRHLLAADIVRFQVLVNGLSGGWAGSLGPVLTESPPSIIDGIAEMEPGAPGLLRGHGSLRSLILRLAFRYRFGPLLT